MTLNSRSAKLSSPNVKVQDVPNKPTIGTPVLDTNSAVDTISVPFTPAQTGGRAAIYRAVSNPGNIEAISYGSSPVQVTGLSDNTSYTFTVRGETSTGATTGYTEPSSSITTSFGAMDLISTFNVTNTSTWALGFSSVPQGYSHLQVRMVARTTDSYSAGSYINLSFNSGANSGSYSWHEMSGQYGSISSGNLLNQGSAYINRFSDAYDMTGSYGVAVIDILDYKSTSKYKTVMSLGGHSANAKSIHVVSSMWPNTSPITGIDISTPGSSIYFTQGSRFSLYGIKG